MIAFTVNTLTKPMLLLTALTCTLLNGAHASTCITAGLMDTAGWAHQFKSGGGEGGLFHEDITLESGVTMTFAELA